MPGKFLSRLQIIKTGSALCFIFLFAPGSFAQENPADPRKRMKKTVQRLVKAISVQNGILNEKSEESYHKYDGKIIHKIIIHHIGFERNILDTARTFRNFITREANKLHTNTREYVIRNNLFIKEGKPLNAYRVADNERWLRNLNYMLDARIYVNPVSEDAVDVVVVTRDVFSLGGSFTPDYPTKFQSSIQNINLSGRGQTVQFGQVIDERRSPKYGPEGSYALSNIGGSFIDGTVGYTAIDHGVSIGNENERSLYLKFNRTLYHPFARFAGGAEISYNSSSNVYRKPDSLFAKYQYTVQDYWIGYSFGHKRLPNDLKENRNRTFVAIRGYDQYFLSSVNTDLTEPDKFIYRNKTSLLAQLTFFRQDFYKTQYVLGFGRTEDVPYGYRVSFTSGWERELSNKRPYLGTELFYSQVRPGGAILTYDVNLASYVQASRSQDGYVAFNFTRYGKIQKLGKFIVRHQYAAGYAAIVNQKVKRGI